MFGQYCELMSGIRDRVKSVSQLMDLPGIADETRVESISLQLRKILELIVFSSLVSNKDVWQRSQKELQSSQNIHRKIRELGHLHPDFYPKPIDLQANASGEEPPILADGFLSEDDLIHVYGQLGNILHADNPLGKETDYGYFPGGGSRVGWSKSRGCWNATRSTFITSLTGFTSLRCSAMWTGS